MKWTRRAIVACLALLAFGAWGVGLRSGLVWGLLSWSGLAGRPAVSEGASVTAISSRNPPAAQTDATPAGLPDSSGDRPIATTATTRIQAVASPHASVSRTRTPPPTATEAVPPDTPTSLPIATLAPPPTPLPSSRLTLTPLAITRSLRVDQDQQTMLAYEDGQVVRLIPVSTGAPYENSFTPAWSGQVGPFWGKAMFRGTDLWADYIWYLFPGALSSILIHSVPYVPNGSEKVYDRMEALGVEPASKGCVRISPEDAEWLAAWNPVGVPIEITPYSGVIKPATTP